MISGTSDCSVGVPLHTNELAGSARGLRLRDEEDAPVHLMLFQFGMRGSHLIHRHCSQKAKIFSLANSEETRSTISIDKSR